MKNYNKYICALVLLLGMSANAWGYTVKFNTGVCNPTVDDVAEASNGAGITLPDGVTPAATGWEFVGWATSSCTESTKAPVIYTAGTEEYKPGANITMYAVYRKYTSGTSSVTFNAANISNLTTHPKYSRDWVDNTAGIELYLSAGSRYTNVTPNTWSVTKSTDAAGTANDVWNYAMIAAYRKITQIDVEISGTSYKIEDDGTGIESDADTDDYWAMGVSSPTAVSPYTQTVSYTGDVDDFATQVWMFATTAQQIRAKTITVTYYNAKFNSNPSDTEISLSKGTQTNATISSFSLSVVPTCSSTDEDRNVTITVAASTGYEFLSTARLTYSGNGTASYVSGPTGSGPYTFVYQFAQDDNGTGTFSVTSASPKTYTITLNGNNGTGHTPNVTATYNSSTLSSSITNPTREGYTFDGWYSGSGGTGSLVINTSGVLQANVSTYTGAGGIWTKDAGTTLYAKWTINKYKVTLSSPNTVTISATSPVVAEGGYTEVNYSSTVTLSYSSLVDGRQWCGWKVTKDADGSNVTASVLSTNTLTVPAYDVTVDAEVYGDYVFSCADLELDEPANGSDNVLSDVIYLTSTSGQKVRSAAHFRVHGDGLTPSQTVKFTTGDDDLDELYTFRKADGTEVATNASGVVDEEVYIYYQPTATTDGRDEVTSVKAYVERKGDGSGKPKAVVNEERTINGRHLPSQFIIAAKAGDYWYALPADMISSSAHAGYSFTPDNATTPTEATVAPEAAIYNLYGYATGADVYNSSYVRFASDKDSKTLWSNKSNSSVGIRDYAAISASSPKGEQYEWRLTNTGADTYNLWNHAANLTGRNLGLQKTDKKWNMYADGSEVVKELRILPVENISAYIELLGEDWQDAAFTYTKVSGEIPSHHHIQVTYNGDTYTATESGTKITITDDDFTEAGGFAAAPGTQLTLEWCNEGGAVLAQGSLFTPIFITSNTVNLSDYEAEVLKTTDVFVTNGAKLTVSDDITVHDVTVNAGSTLVVNDNGGEGKTLEIKNGKLTLRGGWTTIGGVATYDMPRVYINPLSTLKKSSTTVNLYIDIYKAEEGKHYYPLAVPFPVAVNDIDYVDPAVAAASVYGKHYVIKRYNGASRAENGAVDANWEVVPAGSTLQPGEGYIITALAVGGKAQLVVPMKNVANAWTALGEQATVSDVTKNVLEVTHHTGAATAAGGAAKRNEGWNMLGIPFMSCYTSGEDMYDGDGSADLMSGRMTLSGDPADPYAWESSDVVYVSVPTHDFSEYIQTDITSAELVPGWSFFIQVGTTGNLTFLTTEQAANSNMPIYAPKREKAAMPVVKTGIVLSDGEKSDKTTFLISDKYSSDYEIGADLEKMFGNGFTLSTYSVTNGTNLAFNALSTYEAEQAIPVGVRIPAEGEYTFSLNSRYAGANITRLDLIDYEAGEVTNLLQTNYTFTAPRGQNDSRFAINVTKAPQISTDVESTEHGIQGTDIRKVIIDDKLFIIRDGLMYDATGKRVMKGAR